MPKVRDALDVLESIAPARFAFSFDKIGLQVGDPTAELLKGVVSLDRSLAAVQHAAQGQAGLLISHHPLIFEPIASVLETSHVGKTILALARNGIAFASAHTNWDAARGGINDALAKRMGLADARPFGSAAPARRLKVVVFCPSDVAEGLIDAMAAAGAGHIGEYSRCAYYSAGTGTYLGSDLSNPAIGAAGWIERVEEVRIEMVLPMDRRHHIARTIRDNHPYEEPAFDFFVLETEAEQPAGRIGHLSTEMALAGLRDLVNAALGTSSWAWGDPSTRIRQLAVVGGAADSEWRRARDAGADALLTGEVKQHVALEAAEDGFCIVAAGHYATEQPGCEALRNRLAEAMPDVKWDLFVPEPGCGGRPI